MFWPIITRIRRPGSVGCSSVETAVESPISHEPPVEVEESDKEESADTSQVSLACIGVCRALVLCGRGFADMLGGCLKRVAFFFVGVALYTGYGEQTTKTAIKKQSKEAKNTGLRVTYRRFAEIQFGYFFQLVIEELALKQGNMVDNEKTLEMVDFMLERPA